MTTEPGDSGTGPAGADVVLVVPVYRNRDTLDELARRVVATLGERRWRLRLVVDASPDDSLAVAGALAAHDARVAVTALATNVGQHAALLAGLRAEPHARAWVCLDADLQDPPEAVPALLDRLARGDVGAVFAGRRGRYESTARLATGRLHRALMSRLTGLPPDAGAFVAMGPEVRRMVVALDPPSIVAGIGRTRLPLASVPVTRSPRASGASAWTTAARLRQSARTVAWALAGPPTGGSRGRLRLVPAPTAGRAWRRSARRS